MRAVYFHGGPGFSSHAEEVLLSRALSDAGLETAFWNEPSRQRPDGWPFRAEGAFENYLASAVAFLDAHHDERPIVAIGHSFGAHVLRHLCERRPAAIARAIYIAPALALTKIEPRQFAMTANDFEAHGDARSSELDRITSRYTGAFDENTEAAFNLLVQNERLFEFYWQDHDRMNEFLRYFVEPGFGLDLESFFAVRRSMFPSRLSGSPIPAVAIFGQVDPFVRRDEEMEILRDTHQSIREHTIAGAKHYPHVEQLQQVLAAIAE